MPGFYIIGIFAAGNFPGDYGLYSLRENCPNTDFFLVRIFLFSDLIQRFIP